jgi:hypothetical protein
LQISKLTQIFFLILSFVYFIFKFAFLLTFTIIQISNFHKFILEISQKYSSKMDPNNSGFIVEDELNESDFTAVSSIGAMDMKQMAEKIQKLEVNFENKI